MTEIEWEREKKKREKERGRERGNERAMGVGMRWSEQERVGKGGVEKGRVLQRESEEDIMSESLCERAILRVIKRNIGR